MAIVYQHEDFASFMLDAASMWKEHFKEVSLEGMASKRPFVPDIRKYLSLQDSGSLAVFTMREDGILVGYAVFIVSSPMHYSLTPYAVNDALYVSPGYRKGSTGIKFMKWCEKMLVAISENRIKIVQWRTKADHNFGKVLEALGYTPDDIVYTKWVGD
jgi:hypothetical protein